MSFASPIQKSSSSGSAPLTPPLSPSCSAPKVSDVESSLSDKPVDDPFRLRAALRDPDDVAALRRRWNPRKQRHIGKFYETQNEKIDAMLKVCFRGSELLLYDKFSPCVDHGEPRSGGGRRHEGKRLEGMFFFTQHGSTERAWLMV